MWLSKEEYARLKATIEAQKIRLSTHNELVEEKRHLVKQNHELSASAAEVGKQKKELESLIKEAQEVKNNAPRKFTLIKPPAADQQDSFLSYIAEVYNDNRFQWFMFGIRETVLSQVAGNMPGASGMFFLRNNEELAGAIKLFGYIQQQMESKKQELDIIVETEQRVTESHE